MGTGKILLVVTLVVVVVASVLIGLLCAIGSATLDIIFQEIVANQISAVSKLPMDIYIYIALSLKVSLFLFSADLIFVHSLIPSTHFFYYHQL